VQSCNWKETTHWHNASDTVRSRATNNEQFSTGNDSKISDKSIVNYE